jgi:hypothetical protein
LESSTTLKKKYSYSVGGGSQMDDRTDEKDAINALKSLQRERLAVSRLGFVER